jgi:hypothetical protein
MRYRLAWIAIMLSVMLFPGTARVVAQEPTSTPEPVQGRVTGHVSNLTLGGGNLDGAPVVLYALEDFAPRETYDSTVTGDGSFSFDPIALVPGYSYIATLEYQNVAYGSSFVEYDGSTESLQLDIQVYEAVTIVDPIRIGRLHVLVDFAEGWMRVSELYIFDNDSDRVYTGSTGNPDDGTIQVPIPTGVERLEVERGMGENMVSASSSVFEIEGGIMDTLPVRPGPSSQQLMVSYDVAYQDEATVSHRLLYPVTSVSLILPDVGLAVDSDLLGEGGQQSMQGMPFVEWDATDVPAGEILSFRISGVPDLEALAATRASADTVAPQPAARGSALFVSAGDNSTTWALGIGSLVVAIGIAVYLWNRLHIAPSEDRHADLLQQIVELDSAYERGNLSAARYEYEREMLKAQLRAWYGEDQRSV